MVTASLDPQTTIVTESRPSDVLASLHESAEAEREYLFAARDADRSDLVLVAWHDGSAVGYIATTDQQPDGLLIWEHLVVPAHRGRGLGQRLLLEAMRRTVPDAIVEIDPLGELDAQRAVDYYRQLGFSHDVKADRIWATAAGVMRALDARMPGSEGRTSIQALLERKEPGVVTVDPSVTVRSAVSTLNANQIGAVVVSSDGSRVEGILSERDVLRGLDAHQDGFLDLPIGEVTTTDVLTCTTDESIASAMDSMTRLKVRHLPVTEAGHLVGIISLGDLVSYRLDAVESGEPV